MSLLLFELLGENLEMAKEEVKGLTEVLGLPFRVEAEDHLLLMISVDAINEEQKEALGRRLGLTRTVGEVLAGPCGDEAELIEKLTSLDLKTTVPDGSFAIRPKRIHTGDEGLSGTDLASKAGGKVQELTGNPVDLNEPATVLDLFIAERLYLTKRIAEIDRRPLEERRPQFREFFSPVSLHPKFARACINLARVECNFLDAFCGTGGFLIEGGLMGLAVYGSDMDEEMVRGAQENLEQFEINDFKVIKLEVGECARWKKQPGFPAGGFDAVISDPPYGRSSSTGGEDINDIYTQALKNLGEVIKPGGRLLIILPDPSSARLGLGGLVLENIFEQYVHGSLTRHYCLFKKG